MINMFSLVHGRANFIPQAKDIDHVNASELLSKLKNAKCTWLMGGVVVGKEAYQRSSFCFNLKKKKIYSLGT